MLSFNKYIISIFSFHEGTERQAPDLNDSNIHGNKVTSYNMPIPACTVPKQFRDEEQQNKNQTKGHWGNMRGQIEVNKK